MRVKTGAHASFFGDPSPPDFNDAVICRGTTELRPNLAQELENVKEEIWQEIAGLQACPLPQAPKKGKPPDPSLLV